jgi:hypothetical protein
MSDQAVRARVDGRTAVARRTVWQLEVGPLRMRCIATSVECTYEGDPIKPTSAYIVQSRDPKNGWTGVVGAGDDPAELLRRVSGSASVAKFVQKMIEP